MKALLAMLLLSLSASAGASAQASGQRESSADDADNRPTSGQRNGSTPAQGNDDRANLLTSVYIGTAIDNFAAGEFLTYVNPEDAGPTERRLIAGFNFDFRLTGNRNRPTTPTNSQLWLYGETLHGVRSRAITCQSQGAAPACADIKNADVFPGVDDIPAQAAFILHNATSFEGFVGLRWEFLGIHQAPDNRPNDTAGALYLKAQGGLLTFTPDTDDHGHSTQSWTGSDSVDNHLVSIGVVATNGMMSGSYVEVGFGRTDLFLQRNRDRWKLDALLTFSVAPDWLSPFAQIVIDSDVGGGSDSIQSYFGVDVDVTHLWRIGGDDAAAN